MAERAVARQRAFRAVGAAISAASAEAFLNALKGPPDPFFTRMCWPESVSQAIPLSAFWRFNISIDSISYWGDCGCYIFICIYQNDCMIVCGDRRGIRWSPR